MNDFQKKQLIEYLLPKVTEHKQQTMYDVLLNRTRHLTIVLEDLFHQHNASAIVRSAECFGVQDLHVIQKRFKFSVTDGIALGSAKWVDIHSYNSTELAYKRLKEQGYKIVATMPGESASLLPNFPLTEKMAVVFGTENVGLSQYAIDNADAFIKIPMYGFTQSFNVSVSVALCLYDLTERLRQSKVKWQLSQPEQLDIILTWLKRSIRGHEHYIKMFEEQVK